MGIKDEGKPVDMLEEVDDIIELRAKSKTSRRLIEITAVSDRLIDNESYDDDFRILFRMFLLGSILRPTNAIYINLMYLHVLKDVWSIKRKNWATWCFNFLLEIILKYKEYQVRSISICPMFLEVPMHEVNFLQLQSDFPHSQRIESVRLSIVNIKGGMLTESI